jgi:hypothetical protein
MTDVGREKQKMENVHKLPTLKERAAAQVEKALLTRGLSLDVMFKWIEEDGSRRLKEMNWETMNTSAQDRKAILNQIMRLEYDLYFAVHGIASGPPANGNKAARPRRSACHDMSQFWPRTPGAKRLAPDGGRLRDCNGGGEERGPGVPSRLQPQRFV